jgi:hypothetical protein
MIALGGTLLFSTLVLGTNVFIITSGTFGTGLLVVSIPSVATTIGSHLCINRDLERRYTKVVQSPWSDGTSDSYQEDRWGY